MDTLKPGEQRLHNHPVVGQFVVHRFGEPTPGFGSTYPTNPFTGQPMPYFAAGRFYASEEEAVRGFDAMTREAPTLEDRRYSMAEASFGEVE